MIGGAVSGSGGRALGRHNAAPQENGEARPGSSRGLMSEGITEQINELTEEARASGHKAPLKHAYASPPPGASWGAAEWGKYWGLYEKAQGLEDCAYAEQIHDKSGDHDRPEHKHRVYLALTERGTLVRSGWSFAKQEAVSRIMETDTGAAFVKGAHNVRAARIVAELGRDDVATAMAAAGLLDGTRARAVLSPRDRLIQEKTQISKVDVARATAAAWAASKGGTLLADALKAQGLRLGSHARRSRYRNRRRRLKRR